MKNSKFGLLSLAAILGISAAYASKPSHFSGTTYYAIYDSPGKFHWVTTKPGTTYTCIPEAPFCTIHTIGGYIPQSNIVPTASQATPVNPSNTVYQN